MPSKKDTRHPILLFNLKIKIDDDDEREVPKKGMDGSRRQTTNSTSSSSCCNSATLVERFLGAAAVEATSEDRLNFDWIRFVLLDCLFLLFSPTNDHLMIVPSLISFPFDLDGAHSRRSVFLFFKGKIIIKEALPRRLIHLAEAGQVPSRTNEKYTQKRLRAA